MTDLERLEHLYFYMKGGVALSDKDASWLYEIARLALEAAAAEKTLDDQADLLRYGTSIDRLLADHYSCAAAKILAMQPPAEIAGPQQTKAAEDGPQPRRWRHVKSGFEYVEIGRGLLQTSKPIGDYKPMVAYQDHDGVIWVRPQREFEDGRFVEIGKETT